MKLQILGTGCPKCKKTYENVERAVKDLGISAEIEKVEDLKAIMGFGVMITPALAVDGQVKVAGKVPAVEEIKRFIAEKGQS
jgi:small redox-active disulfide protein 2